VRKNIIALACITALAAGGNACSSAASAAKARKDDNQMLQVGNLTRLYRVHLPAGYDATKKYPVVLVLHGAAANNKMIESVTGMSKLADREQFIAVYPNGTGKFSEGWASWNGGMCCGWAVKHKVDDIGFLDKLISTLETEYSVDPHRVYLAGFSNGGMLGFAGASRLQDKVAAMGIVEGSMTGSEPRPTKVMPVIMFHGTDDKRVSINGGKGRFAKFGLPVNDKSLDFATTYWATVDHAVGEPKITNTPDLTRYEYRDASGKPVVVVTRLMGGGHAWAGGEKSRAWGAKPAKNISASEEMWRFFQQWTR
jgi:polyhydroxybutyrate depolymerase